MSEVVLEEVVGLTFFSPGFGEGLTAHVASRAREFDEPTAW